MFPSLLALAGCTGNGFTYQGTPIWEMFPFDGERTWEYQSTDVEATYKVITTSSGEAEKIDGKNVYTLVTHKECTNENDPDCVDLEEVFRISWSSDSVDGVFVWGYAAEGEPYVELRPPVQVASRQMRNGESIDTTTGGVIWTSAFDGIAQCPIKIVADWPECAVLRLTVDGGPNFPLAGEWYATAGNGIAAFQHEGEDSRWELASLACEGECTGEW